MLYYQSYKADDQKKSTGSVGSLTFEDYTASTIGKEDAFDWNKVTDGENGATTKPEQHQAHWTFS